MKMMSPNDSKDNGGLSNPGYVNDPQDSSDINQNSSYQRHNNRMIKVNPVVNNNKVEELNIEDVVDGSSGQKCRLFGCIPMNCCHPFMTAGWVLLFLCWAAIVQGMVINGIVNVAISTLERRFALQSTESGIIVGSYDLGSMLAVLPVTYFGGRLGASKPRYIAIGLVVMGTGSLIYSLPHFLTDTYEINDMIDEDPSDLCDSKLNAVDCNADKAAVSLRSYRYFFMIGQFLHGVGASPLITLGTTFLDESVSRNNAPMYIGIFQTAFVIGPAFGYLAGGEFLRWHTDLDVLDSDTTFAIDSSSNLWVGAWWIGFVLAWILAWLCAFFMIMYPKVLPGAEKYNEVKHSEGFGSIKDFPRAMKALFKNPTYMFINFGSSMDGFSIACMATFTPKFIQYQYNIASSTASMLIGMIAVPAGGGGTFLGGYITKRFKLNRCKVIKMYMWCQLITIPALFAFLFTCPSPQFAGINVSYQELSSLQKSSSSLSGFNLTSSCNSQCVCSDLDYDPICGNDNRMYFNPCFAGCATQLSTGSDSNFTDCSCVNDDIKWASKIPCDVGCDYKMIGFLVLSFLAIFFTFMSAMPNIVATLRSVEPIHRSLGLGIESIITRILGTIPGPIIYGYLIDESCELWQTKPCEEADGGCVLYDNFTMAIYLLVVLLIVKALAVVFFALALFFSKRSHIKDELNSDEI